VSEDAVDPAELLERLRSERHDLPWAPLPPSAVVASWPNHVISRDEALSYLNDHWVLPDRPDPARSGRGLRGTLRRLIGRLTFSVLRPYLDDERELLSRLVQVCNTLSVRCDEMGEALADRQRAEAKNGALLAEWLDSSRGPGNREVHDEGG
jgi:hypothetical protein